MKRFIKRIVPLIFAVVYTVSMPLETHAIDSLFYSSNDILFYDESDTACTSERFALAGKDNREKIFNFLKGKGLNQNQAAGVLANIDQEGDFSPTRHEDGFPFNEMGYGIVQWTGGRRTALEAHLKKTIPETFTNYYKDGYGGTPSEADGFVPRNRDTNELMPLADNDAFLSSELLFLFDETSSRKITASTAAVSSAKVGQNEWEALKAATTIEDATKIWLYNFEIPADIAKEAEERSVAAREILALMGGGVSAGGTTTGCVDSTSGDVAALQATVANYAWPEYHPPSYVTLKPEYAAAVEKAAATGGYVGGNRYRGVDCGGFVTRVMVDSGYDPTYNANKGPTSIQKTWLDDNWENIGNGSSIDTATLRPGDVAMLPGHTFMFAGTNIEGFGKGTAGWKGIASASLDERAPMAGLESLTGGGTTWYRKKVVSHE